MNILWKYSKTKLLDQIYFNYVLKTKTSSLIISHNYGFAWKTSILIKLLFTYEAVAICLFKHSITDRTNKESPSKYFPILTLPEDFNESQIVIYKPIEIYVKRDLFID